MASATAVLRRWRVDRFKIVRCVFAFWGVLAIFVATAAASEKPAAETPAQLAIEMPPVPDNPKDLLAVDDTMRAYFSGYVKSRSADSRRLRELVDAILQPTGLHFAYDAELSLGARDTFRLRRGNCVAFSFLVAAITREFGFKSSFQNVDTLPVWNRFGSIVASIQHVNVRVVATDGAFIVDLRPDAIPNVETDAIHMVRDEREFAHFYNNIGFFHLVHGRFEDAVSYTSRAAAIDPTYAGAWANLGGLYTQSGNVAAARESYEKSIQLDRYGLIAIVGLAHLLQQSSAAEDRARAEKLGRRARSIEARNPYFQQYQARQARDKGDLAEAEKLFKLAIALKDDEPEFYTDWIAVLQQLGRPSDAHRAQAKLDKLNSVLAKRSAHIAQ